MRLKYIKLVGFKSFVDPTKVPFPHQMTCVVGPNGCGKSNVIDAVRWVLGESSAKNLRGDAMTDVIFNGSSARKPVSQASVELVFDNSAGRIQGEFADYAEISVKRQVTRDGQSNYFLNNSKCRRRDITDLFLGTGLGPRSYAIIEQGMISRLIESKPQELRVFIEEAAGISKYKERRRETETRMQHTRDNLDRLNDVRQELGSQLDKLLRQAAAARRYKELKAQERQYKAQLQALRWLAHEQHAQQLRSQLAEHQNELEKWQAQQRGSERGSIELREQVATAKQQLDQVQQQYYQLGNQITRFEAQLQQGQQQLSQRQQRLQQVQHELEQLAQTQQQDQQQAEELEWQQQQLQPDYHEAEQQALLVAEQVEQVEQEYLAWQDDYQQFLQLQQQAQQGVQQVQLQQQQLGLQLRQCDHEQDSLSHELEQLQQQLMQLDNSDFAAQVSSSEAALAHTEQQFEQQQQQLHDWQQHSEQLQQQRDEQQTERQQLQGRISSLQQLLAASQAASWPEAVATWLAQQGLKSSGQVRHLLQINTAWQLAAEQILAPWLSAWVLAEPPTDWPLQLGARLVLLQSQPAPQGSLAEQVAAPLQQWPLLQQIGLAACQQQAQQLLASGQWHLVLTPQGQLWSAAGYQAAAIAAADSELQQQQSLQHCQSELEQVSQTLAQLDQQHQQLRQQCQQCQQQLAEQRPQLHEQQAQHRVLLQQQQWQLQQHQQLQQRVEQLQQRQQQLLQQQTQLNDQLEASQQQLTEAQHQLDQYIDDGSWQQRRTELQQQRQRLREQQQLQQQQLQQLQQLRQQRQAQIQQLQVLQQRSQQQAQQLTQQLEQLRQPDVELQEQQELTALQLHEHIEQRAEVDELRRSLSNQVSELEQQLRDLSSGAQSVDSQLERARNKVQSVQLELAALQERSRTVLAVLQDMQQPLKPVLESLPEAANEKAWQVELERLQGAISRLGAINLAAIDEADVLAERKDYLDQQHTDLSASLETLESAIRTIDKETRQRFKTTFDAVNEGLQELFPKVFGGGSAYLDLTDTDLLETGVTIMARPPGKKNSTIHLLSGGEKALTALSLVFAIFRLNPAPFCLLDEVDAPLDDANVGRFCRLVEEMSASVQFIYISHNKVAMEMASHLAGVTMQEPGVSRLVAVDIDAAVALTEAS
ncbi:chromosome segregation protein SMC [Pseudidiomarina mangrovi]|uniref:chromosome segregation protein SMC n=1 Tax=Pseudidiomarina mangrovi TaxID=2487133 RepID=UPI000FC9AC40|nr:chromosome segregation protein SMC [Pseudidiomarina mangrovi]